jgi:hypothetical protein
MEDLYEGYEHAPVVTFALDHRLRIVYCNEAWDRFAESNGGAAMKRRTPYGSNVLDVVPEFLKPLYRSAFLNVFATRRNWEFHYECSSATDYRLFRMSVTLSAKNDDLIVVVNSLVELRPHGQDRPVGLPDPDLYVGRGGGIAMCFICRRTRRRDAGGWDWVPSYIESPPAPLVYTFCDACLRKLHLKS